MRENRREFSADPGATAAVAWRASACPRSSAARAGTRIAFTSFWARLQHGRELIHGAGAPGFPPTPSSTCADSFGADGCQLDVSQIASTEASATRRPQAAARRSRPVRRALGQRQDPRGRAALRGGGDGSRAGSGPSALRVALLSGRRYETFKTLASWREFADHWQQTLPRLKPALDRERLPVGIENHKDWRADELVALSEIGGQPLPRRLHRLRQQHLAARRPAGDGHQARALRGHHAPEGHGGAALRARLRAFRGAARHRASVRSRRWSRSCGRPVPRRRCASR